MPSVASIFGPSPVRPLEKHIGVAYECAKQLKPLFEAAVEDDWDTVVEIKAEIDRLEQKADEIKNGIRLHLPKSLFMPVPRQDLLELLLVQDRIANRARDVAGLVLLRNLAIPESVADDFVAFVARNVDAAKQARKSVRELDELFTAGFRGAEVELVSGMIDKLDNIESDSDALQMKLNRAVFEIESTLEPVHTMFLYRVIELTGEIADMAERVGRRLEMLLAH